MYAIRSYYGSFTNLIYEGDRERVLSTIKQAVTRNHSYEVEYRIEDVHGELSYNFV